MQKLYFPELQAEVFAFQSLCIDFSLACREAGVERMKRASVAGRLPPDWNTKETILDSEGKRAFDARGPAYKALLVLTAEAGRLMVELLPETK